jgi:hypothetical protein
MEVIISDIANHVLKNIPLFSHRVQYLATRSHVTRQMRANPLLIAIGMQVIGGATVAHCRILVCRFTQCFAFGKPFNGW